MVVDIDSSKDVCFLGRTIDRVTSSLWCILDTFFIFRKQEEFGNRWLAVDCRRVDEIEKYKMISKSTEIYFLCSSSRISSSLFFRGSEMEKSSKEGFKKQGM